MTPQKIQSTAADKTAAIAAAIKEFIGDGRKTKKEINLMTVGETAGIQNLGKLLTRPGITMITVFRVLGALEQLCLDNGKSIRPLHNKIVEVLTD